MIQRMSLQEVQEVARLASQRQAVVYGNGPTVDRIADALGLPPAQVESLLIEIRDRQAGLLPPDRSAQVKRVGIGAAIVGTLAFGFFLFNFFTGMKQATSVSSAPDVQPVASASVPAMPQRGTGANSMPIATRAPESVAGPGIDSGLSNGTIRLGQEEFKNEDTFVENGRKRLIRRKPSTFNRNE